MSQANEVLLATVNGLGALLILAAASYAQTRNRKKGDRQ